ncbi:cysteine hydrolase family protein [Bordetella holmesii]|uniref:Isochorismatase family protein n=2 Tax=Bordetella holmesii TaxID=35814 RepID=A0A158M6M9_9BORD|nr:isochorismatase family protein [Bordetella holmesii]AHV94604.1 isochorismatase family protein [Bordetella holmesii ATCC 51541]AIT26696.1 isochorismatase family protein [Bordetella holmesii 44057]EWM41731.1 isochorismatase family protein [Bordetella holmesii 41130]EWM47282.1 isochorismatase family protein [Bordetella holmesii 35009]EWM51439.1 isochorismatase family protein [Bordetella holmesii 70147]
MKQALLFIDVQESFRQCPFWDETELTVFARNAQSLVDAAQARGIDVLQVFHVNTTNPESVFAPESGYVRTLAEVRVTPTAIFHKNVHSALFARDAEGNTLHAWLTGHGIEEVIIAGIRTEQCCETTARHASDSGYKVRFVTDATLTFAMQSPAGTAYTPAQIRDCTELVLATRFARIVPAARALED